MALHLMAIAVPLLATVYAIVMSVMTDWSNASTFTCRALALKQVTNRDVFKVVLKEACAGCMMGKWLQLFVSSKNCKCHL